MTSLNFQEGGYLTGRSPAEAQVVTQSNFKVVVVGAAGVGKTQLCKSFVAEGVFEEKYVATSFETYFASTEDEELKNVASFTIYDCGGANEFASLRPLSYPETDVFLLCYAIDDKESLKQTEDFLKEIKEHTSTEVPILLIGTKVDLRDDAEDTKIAIEHAKEECNEEDEKHRHHRNSLQRKESIRNSAKNHNSLLGALAKPGVSSRTSSLNFKFCTGIVPVVAGEAGNDLVGGATTTASLEKAISAADSNFVTFEQGMSQSSKLQAFAFIESSAKKSEGIQEIFDKVKEAAAFGANLKLEQIEHAHVEAAEQQLLHPPAEKEGGLKSPLTGMLKKTPSFFAGVFGMSKEADDLDGAIKSLQRKSGNYSSTNHH